MSLTRTAPEPRAYLPDIDGLRALAVLAVILFHLEVPGLGGGYVGVDMFFVISGFLISDILAKRMASGSFRFGDFYAGRVRRLFPAVLATVAATFLAGWVLLPPSELAAFARSVAAAIFSLANVVFYSESGYWDGNAKLKPLLHMWSLGVEEQFYLLWPATLLLLRAGRNARVYLAGVLALLGVSLGVCIAWTRIDQPAAFYLLPFRVWQFCLGALAVELWNRWEVPPAGRQLLRIVGLALCVISIATFRDGSTFPGWRAVLPSLGSALVLLASSATEPSPILAHPVARWIGRASYAMYLVHWPLIALYRNFVLRNLKGVELVGLAGATLLATVLLHYGVERRFYQRGTVHQARSFGLVRANLLVGAAVGALALFAWYAPDLAYMREARLSAQQVAEHQTRRWIDGKTSCSLDGLQNRKLCPEHLKHPVLVLGNSHELDGYNFMNAALAPGHDLELIRFGRTNSCNLRVVKGRVVSRSSRCKKRLAALSRVKWEAVLYSINAPFSPRAKPVFALAQEIKRRNPEAKIVTLGGYIHTKERCDAYIHRFGSSEACKAPSRVNYFERRLVGRRHAKRVLSKSDLYIDKVALLCSDGTLSSCLTETPEGAPMFLDRHHLTYEFARMIGELYRQQNPGWMEALLERAPPSGRLAAEPPEEAGNERGPTMVGTSKGSRELVE